jgi:hypothetical protein
MKYVFLMAVGNSEVVSKMGSMTIAGAEPDVQFGPTEQEYQPDSHVQLIATRRNILSRMDNVCCGNRQISELAKFGETGKKNTLSLQIMELLAVNYRPKPSLQINCY